jgi:predicted flavoprotein YhiN
MMNYPIDLLPGVDLAALLEERQRDRSRMELKTFLSRHLPRRLAEAWCDVYGGSSLSPNAPSKSIRRLAEGLHRWIVTPSRLKVILMRK